MNILFIVHRIPYPPNKGDKIRSFNEIKYLSHRHNLYLAFLIDDEKDLVYVDELKKYCIDLDYEIITPRWQKIKSIPYLLTDRPLSIPYFYSRKLQGAINTRLDNSAIDAIICFSSPMAEYIYNSNMYRNSREFRPKLIMDFVDVDSDKWKMYAGLRQFPLSAIYKREWKTLMSYEQKTGRVFDCSIFVSENEAELFRSFCPAAQVTSISNGVDAEFYDNKGLVQNRKQNNYHTILFMGAMDYFPNEDAVIYFASDIWPVVKKELPDTRFYIVGGNPSRKVKMLAAKDGDIVITGYVPDVRPYLYKADVFVAPLRIARGVQNKVLEAMAAGVPVVARPEAVQGLTGFDGSIKVAKDSREFAVSIFQIIKETNETKKNITHAKQFISNKHSWDVNLKVFDKLLN